VCLKGKEKGKASGERIRGGDENPVRAGREGWG